jgi:hypothetical protein
VDIWSLAAAIFFCTMGIFAGAAALYVTATPVNLLGHQAAEIVLFCMFAIALFAVIATLANNIGANRPNGTRAPGRSSEILWRAASGASAPQVLRHRQGRLRRPIVLNRKNAPSTTSLFQTSGDLASLPTKLASCK